MLPARAWQYVHWSAQKDSRALSESICDSPQDVAARITRDGFLRDASKERSTDTDISAR